MTLPITQPVSQHAGAMSGKSIMVTGGTGLLGSHFILDQVNEGVRVVALVRGQAKESAHERVIGALRQAAIAMGMAVTPDKWSRLIEIVDVDLVDPALVDRIPALLSARGDLTECWHFAATLRFREAHRQAIIEQNVHATGRMIDVAKALGVPRFVYVSSSYAAGAMQGEIPETLLPRGLSHHNVYEESKYRAEWLVAERCEAAGLSWRILRPSVVVGNGTTLLNGQNTKGFYGALRELHLLRQTIAEQEEGIRIVGDPNVEIDLIGIDDFIADVRGIIERDFAGGPVYNVTATKGHSVEYIFKTMCETIGVPPLRWVKSEDELRSPIERLAHERVLFYRSYLLSPKRFARTLPSDRGPTRMQLEGMARVYVRELEGESFHSIVPRMDTPTRDGLVLAGFRSAETTGTPVLLCNAFGMPMEFWSPIARRLQGDYCLGGWESRFVPMRADAFDPERAGVDWHLDDLEEARRRFGFEQPILVGWSTGARIALRYAIRRPENVRALVLLNGSYVFPDGRGSAAATMTLLELLRRVVANPRYAAFYHRYIFQGDDGAGDLEETWTSSKRISELLNKTDPEVLHLLNTPWRTKDSMLRFAHMFSRYYDVMETEEEISGIACPSLVVACGLDPFGDDVEGQRRVANLLPNSEFLCLEDGDHHAFHTREEIGEWVENFCEQLVDAPEVRREEG